MSFLGKPPNIKFIIPIIILGILVVGLGSFIAIDKMSKNNNSAETDQNNTCQNIEKANDKTENFDITENNSSSITIKEWGIEFTIPETLTDIRYVIDENTAYLVGRPSDGSLQFPAEH